MLIFSPQRCFNTLRATLVFTYYTQPEVIVLETYDIQIDSLKHDGKIGQIYVKSNGCIQNELWLDSQRQMGQIG